MKRFAVIALGVVAVTASALAQAPAGRGAPPPPPPALEAGASQADVDLALLAAPAGLKDQATVIKWTPDHNYTTLRKGTNRLVCYDRSGEPGQQPFAVQCSSVANIPRIVQNMKFEAMPEKGKAAVEAAEKDGTRVKPEYGSVWYTMNGADQATARTHITIAVPGATTASTGLPSDNKQGGVWIMNAGTSTAHLMTPGS